MNTVMLSESSFYPGWIGWGAGAGWVGLGVRGYWGRQGWWGSWGWGGVGVAGGVGGSGTEGSGALGVGCCFVPKANLATRVLFRKICL